MADTNKIIGGALAALGLGGALVLISRKASKGFSVRIKNAPTEARFWSLDFPDSGYHASASNVPIGQAAVMPAPAPGTVLAHVVFHDEDGRNLNGTHNANSMSYSDANGEGSYVTMTVITGGMYTIDAAAWQLPGGGQNNGDNYPPGTNIISYTLMTLCSPVTGGVSAPTNGTYGRGTDATVTADPAPGYKFVNWSEDGQVVGTTPILLLPMDRDHTLLATFTLDVPGNPPGNNPPPETPEPGSPGYKDPKPYIDAINAAKASLAAVQAEALADSVPYGFYSDEQWLAIWGAQIELVAAVNRYRKAAVPWLNLESVYSYFGGDYSGPDPDQVPT